MGILDSVIGSVLGGNGNNQQQVVAMQLIAALFKQSGGTGALLEKLQQGGLTDALTSWVGSGANQNVAGSSVSAALGNDLIGSIAQKVGVDSGTAANLLAQYLPLAIDKITPNGSVAEAKGFDLSDGLDVGDLTALAAKFLK